MEASTVPNGNPQIHRGGCPTDGPEKEAVLRELESILSSPFFRTSNRSKQFLSYVVQHMLDGNQQPLKERTLGTKLFHRPAGYATGDDPVVRVQAGEVRRRLEQYHHAALNHSPVRIELPVGSYAPEFRWASAAPPPDVPVPAEPPKDEPTQTAAHSGEEPPDIVSKSPRRFARAKPLLSLGLVLAMILLAAVVYRESVRKTVLEQFWAPVLATSGPVLICLAKPMVYRPSAELYRKYSATPAAFDTERQRLGQPPPLQPQDKLVWGDMVEYPDFGVASGDVYAAVRLSALLGRMDKESQVRIGTNYSFADLRKSPAIVVGAFNNRWTMQMTSNLHFTFEEEGGKQLVREQVPAGRVWYLKVDPHGEVTEDFGVVTRLLNSKTGHFVVAAAGIGADGTEAAGEFVSSSEYLEEALRTAPSDWTKKNLQFVVQTTVTDSVAGPPQVVAIYMW